MWFGTKLDLRINLDKSEIFPVGRIDNIESLNFLYEVTVLASQFQLFWTNTQRHR